VSDGNYLDVIDDLFVGIKGSNPGQPEGFSLVVLPDGHSGEEMIAYVKQAAKKHKLINIIFHGIGGDHLSVTTEAHEQLVKYLAENRDIYWTDTYLNIMKHANDQL
ncbi:MAG TPA: polysaccharide deacetylase, partial [Cellvibrionaceae bacterium]